MSVFNKNLAHEKAIEIVKTALQSGAIKLHTGERASSKHEVDAAYLNGLINSLAENLTAK